MMKHICISSSSQDAFPLIQRVLGQIASYSEKIKNTFNFSVPFLSILAIISLLIISIILMFINIRYEKKINV